MAQRYALIDGIRGLAIVNMILYHAIWDLVYLYGFDWQWYLGPVGTLWQQAICWTFILVSGFCLPLSSHPVQRGVEVSLAGLAVTMVTLAVMPAARIVFGVLTCIGAAMILCGLAQPLFCAAGAACCCGGERVLSALSRDEACAGRLHRHRWLDARRAPVGVVRRSCDDVFRPAGAGFFQRRLFPAVSVALSLCHWLFSLPSAGCARRSALFRARAQSSARMGWAAFPLDLSAAPASDRCAACDGFIKITATPFRCGMTSPLFLCFCCFVHAGDGV